MSDEAVCREAKQAIPPIAALAVKQGIGDATINIHPRLALRLTRQAVEGALGGDPGASLLPLPERFVVEMSYASHLLARKCSFYPGARQIDPHTVVFEAEGFFDVLRMKLFI